MLSKRGNAKGKSQSQNKPKKNKQKASKPVRNRRSAGAGMGSQSRAGLMVAPIATGIVQSGFFGMRFGSAASHDEFPEGGLRIAGKLPTQEGVFTQGNSSGLFGLFASGTLASALINPAGELVTSTTEPLFNYAGPLAVFSQYFRRFRFRKLALEVTSEVPPGATTAAAGAGLVLQVSHEPDGPTASSNSTGYTMDTAIVSRNCTRFSAWAARMVCPVISETSTSRADELFYLGAAEDTPSTGSSIRQMSQGAVTAVGSKLNGTGALVVSKVLVEFVVDLYGFTNIATADVSRRRVSRERVSLEPKLRIEAKEPERKRPVCGHPDCAPDQCTALFRARAKDDYVEISPKSSSKAVQSDFPLQPVSRPQSLKGSPAR
jgi:hypothetical protein